MSCGKENITPVGQKFQSDIEGIHTLLAFHPDGHFYGQMVNTYFGIYELKDTQMKLTLQGTSLKFRTPQQMEAEERYFQNLKRITNFKLDKNVLILNGDKIEYRFQPLNSD